MTVGVSVVALEPYTQLNVFPSFSFFRIVTLITSYRISYIRALARARDGFRFIFPGNHQRMRVKIEDVLTSRKDGSMTLLRRGESMSFRPIARDKDLIIQKLNDEIVVYDLNTNNALYLNETSAMIWNLCDGERSVADIRKVLREEFDTLVSSDFINFAIYQLRKDKLLSESVEIDRYLKKFSGRRAIKKLGHGSMMALPSITSVTAPTAIAASCLAVPPVNGAVKTAQR